MYYRDQIGCVMITICFLGIKDEKRYCKLSFNITHYFCETKMTISFSTPIIVSCCHENLRLTQLIHTVCKCPNSYL